MIQKKKKNISKKSILVNTIALLIFILIFNKKNGKANKVQKPLKKKPELLINDNEEILSSDSELEEKNENYKSNKEMEPNYLETG